MNCETYLFGNLLSEFTAYPNDYATGFFKGFAKRMNSETQLCIRRKNDLMYYCYLRQLVTGESYIGFCVVLNGVMFSHPTALFHVFEDTVAAAAERGEIIRLLDDGNIGPAATELFKNEEEVEFVRNTLYRNVCTLEKDTYSLPPQNYGKAKSKEESLSIGDGDDEIARIAASSEYTIVSKDKDYNSPRLNSYSGVIKRLSESLKNKEEENNKLKISYAKLNRQKKQYRLVIALIFCLFIVFACFYFMNADLQQTREKLYNTENKLTDAKDEIKQQQDTISSIRIENTQLQTDLNNVRSELNASEITINSQQSTINTLNSKIRDLQQELSWYRDYDY